MEKNNSSESVNPSEAPIQPIQHPINNQKGNFPIILGVLVLLLVIGGGAYYFGKMSNKPTETNELSVSNNGSNIQIKDQSPNPANEANNLKTYINSKRGYQFNYPEEYKLEEAEATKTTFEGAYLQKDTEFTVGGGLGGSNVLKKGVVISFTVFPNKDISDTALKSEYGSDIALKAVQIGGKEGTEIIFQPETYAGRKIFTKLDNAILELSSNSGFETNKQDQATYLSDFNKILSTFNFTN